MTLELLEQDLPNEGEFQSCPFCGSTKIIKRGQRTTKIGKNQKFGCHNCGHRFTPSFYIKLKQQIKNKTIALQLYNSGKSSRCVSKELRDLGISLSYTTITTASNESELFDRFDGGNTGITWYSVRHKTHNSVNNDPFIDEGEVFERFNQPKRHNQSSLPVYSVITLFDHVNEIRKPGRKKIAPVIKIINAKPLPENPRPLLEIFKDRGVKHKYKEKNENPDCMIPTIKWDGVSIVSDEYIKGGVGSHFLVKERMFLIGFKDPEEAFKLYKKAFPRSRRTFGAIVRFINSHNKTGGIPDKDYNSNFKYYNWIKPWERHEAKLFQPSVYNKEYWATTTDYEKDNYLSRNDLGAY